MELNDIFKKYFNPSPDEPSKVNNQLCKKCGGQCCKSMGCHISPFDLKNISITSIISLIDESDCISIDWWDGNPITEEIDDSRVYFLRIKNKNSKIVDPSYGGVCSILTNNGCPLSFEYRPKGARDLIPKELYCHDRYSKRQCAIDWLTYQDVMSEVYNHYEDKEEDIFEDIMKLIINLNDRSINE